MITGEVKMIYLLFGSLLAIGQDTSELQDLYVAPPTIHDANLEEFQPYLNSLLVSAAQSNSHWVKRAKRASGLLIQDKHTIALSQDTTCDYQTPLVCATENMHWVMVTDIFVTPNFATIVVKLYDEDATLIASASKSSYSVQKCKEQVTTTTIKNPGRPAVKITEKKPDKCVYMNPRVLASDIKQVTTIAFASIHPPQ
jgi:hypothetical protein